MQQATVTAQGCVNPIKENAARQRKRSRNEEARSSSQKASKFRRSNASSSAIANGAAIGSGGALGRPNFAVDPNIRAKQTQLFGFRPPPSTGLSKKRKGVQKTSNNKRLPYQTALSENFHLKKEKTRAGKVKDLSSLAVDKEKMSPQDFDIQMTEETQKVDKKASSRVTPTAQANQESQIQKVLSTVSVSTAATSDVEEDINERLSSFNSLVILASDKQLLTSRITASTLQYDLASYGPDWILHHRSREESFQPWQMALSGSRIEKQRLAVIETYWDSMKIHKTTPATIFIAINNFSRLLSQWDTAELEHPSSSRWALTALVAYRLAFKTEERPEVLWEIDSFWNIFPIFNDWVIDRSQKNVNKVEMEALRLLEDSMDVPLAPMFLSLYVAAGGWPRELIAEYRELGLYLLSLSTFATHKDCLLRNVVPSKLAAAALALAVKIVNGDRCSGIGIVRHLKDCQLATPNRATVSSKKMLDPKTDCICRYEFFPMRLASYSGLTIDEINPVIRGLSCLLRQRPPETAVLKHYFPVWGDNDWQ